MWLFIILIIVGILLDQITKALAFKYLKNKYIDKKGFIRLYYLENSGSAMGKFSGRLWFLSLCTLVSLIFIFFILKFYDLNNRIMLSIGLISLISGILGNFIDRVIRFHVIDFFYFKIKSHSSPVFNIADFEILIGIILLIIGFIFEV